MTDTNKPFVFRMRPPLRRALERAAKRAGLTLAEYIRAILARNVGILEDED